MNRMRNYFGGMPSQPTQQGPSMQPNPRNPFAKMGQWMGMFRQFMQNPMSAFMGSGMNIPDNIQGNPEAITNYLRSSGTMNDDAFNTCSQLASMAQTFLGGKKF